MTFRHGPNFLLAAAILGLIALAAALKIAEVM